MSTTMSSEPSTVSAAGANNTELLIPVESRQVVNITSVATIKPQTNFARPVKKQIRKRGRDDSSSSSSNHSDTHDNNNAAKDGSGKGSHVDLVRLQDIRAEQKARNARGAGLDASRLLDAATITAATAAANSKLLLLQEASASAASSENHVSAMFAKFSEGRSNAIDDGSEDPLMLKYVEEKLREAHEAKMAAKTASSSSSSTKEQSLSSSSSRPTTQDNISAEDILKNPDLLYAVPEHLRGKSSLTPLQQLQLQQQQFTSKTAAAALAAAANATGTETGVGTGGMLLGGTGIAEVAMPSYVKEKNARETEMLRDQLIARRARALAASGGGGGGGGASNSQGSGNHHHQQQRRHYQHPSGTAGAIAAGPALASVAADGGDEDDEDTNTVHRHIAGSYTANYSHHRREYALSMREGEATNNSGGDRGGQRRDGGGGRRRDGDGGSGGSGGYNNNNNNRRRDDNNNNNNGSNNRQQGGGGNGNNRRDTAHDDELFKRFKKHEIASVRNR